MRERPIKLIVVNSGVGNAYVDDWLRSFGGENKAEEHLVRLRELLNKDCFHLTKWTSNDLEVLQIISANTRPERARRLGVSFKTIEGTFG